MKKFVLACVLVLALAVPAMAQEDDWSFEIGLMRYRFDHEVSSYFGGDLGDSQEYMDDDFDTQWVFKKGDITLSWELELSDNNMGDDYVAQASWDDTLGAYSGKWTPESMADNGFRLEVGDFGTGFGKNVNNDDSPRGSIEVGWTVGTIDLVLGYGKVYEGFTNDDLEGDEHLLRGQIHMPLGESGFSIGAYGAMYTGSDLILQAYAEVEEVDYSTGTVTVAVTPEVTGELSAFLGSIEMSGAMSGFELYAEAGFATGSAEVVDEVSDVAVEGDLSGFYALGGMNFAAGQLSVGVEAGFGSGDDDAADLDNEAFLGFNNDFGFDDIIEDELADDGLSNKIYAKVSVGLSPTEKMSVEGAAIYVAPVEEVAGVNGNVDSYGFEIDGSMSYKLADYLTYSLTGAFASLEEDWVGEDSAYQLVNRLEFLF
jgi:hypothetical protein